MTDNSILFFLTHSFDSHHECLEYYSQNICLNLMYQQPTLITQVTRKLINSIENFAKNNCLAYKHKQSSEIYTRSNLLNRNLWMSQGVSSDRIIYQHTSGSTSGEPFGYYSDKKYFDFIQRNSQCDLILKEYDLYNKPLKILNLFKHGYNPQPENKNFWLHTQNYSNRKFHSYGAETFDTYFINWDRYMENPDRWHKNLFDFLYHMSFDIVLGSGPVFNILCKYIKKYSFNTYFAHLLSHTTEYPRISDFEFMKNNSNINYYCDHMRCWDGGASFFTCKYGVYHLNDNFSWVREDPDSKLISTDYFNTVAPFVDYWNGDLCEIRDEYQLCNCGRYYRPFKMLENRPFALKGPTRLMEIKKQIGVLAYKYKINQVQFENLGVNIHLNQPLTGDEQLALQHILKDYKVNFYE